MCCTSPPWRWRHRSRPFLNYTWPLLIVLLAAPLRGLRLGPQRLLGVGLGAAGAVLLLSGGARFPVEAFAGFACAIAAALTWALYSVLSARFAAVPTEAVAGFCLVAALLTLAAHCLLEPRAIPDPAQWLVVLLLGLGPMRAAFFLWDIGDEAGRSAAARHARLCDARRLHPAPDRAGEGNPDGADPRRRRPGHRRWDHRGPGFERLNQDPSRKSGFRAIFIACGAACLAIRAILR
jgi:hypothetical protein